MAGRFRRGARRVGAYVAEPMNLPALHAQGRTVGRLARSLRAGGAAGELQMVLHADRRIDYPRSAELQRARAEEQYLAGRLPPAAYERLRTLTPGELRMHLDRRLAPTARRVYARLAAAAALFAIWVAAVVHDPAAYTAPFYVLAWFALFASCLVDALLAAHTNWQIRSGRVAGLGEFLRRADSWWPVRRR